MALCPRFLENQIATRNLSQNHMLCLFITSILGVTQEACKAQVFITRMSSFHLNLKPYLSEWDTGTCDRTENLLFNRAKSRTICWRGERDSEVFKENMCRFPTCSSRILYSPLLSLLQWMTLLLSLFLSLHCPFVTVVTEGGSHLFTMHRRQYSFALGMPTNKALCLNYTQACGTILGIQLSDLCSQGGHSTTEPCQESQCTRFTYEELRQNRFSMSPISRDTEQGRLAPDPMCLVVTPSALLPSLVPG